MADHEEKEHTETAASTPTSSSHHDNRPDGGTKAPKDRSCPFCGQAFTSSSLGRHLDLYIKPKNPKPPDGVHDVEEIMKMRGSITRRQPKSGAKPRAVSINNATAWHGTRSSKDSTAHDKSAHVSAPPRVAESATTGGSPEDLPPPSKDHNLLSATNSSHWMNTGIIPNLPPRAPSRSTSDSRATTTGQAQRMREMRQDSAGHKTPRPEPDADTAENIWKLHEDAEVGRAAELALREILSSIQAARERDEPRELFAHVDFMSLSFPGLCLAILPAPGTLFTPTPFPGGESWSLIPPGQKQFDTLNRLLHARVKEIQNGDMSRFPESLHFKHTMHLQDAFEHWQTMSEAEQASIWTLETLRAFAHAQHVRLQATQELEAANNRIRHLEQEFDRLSRCQLPREYLLHPPHTMPATPSIVKDLNNIAFNSRASEVDFDADALLDRWRNTVRATKPKRRPPIDPTSRAPAQTYHVDAGRPAPLGSEYVMSGSVHGIGGPFPRAGCDNEPSPRQVTSNVDYTTPPNPGAVLSVDDEDVEGGKGDGVAQDAALIRSGESVVGEGAGLGEPYGRLNQNGKRALSSLGPNGRSAGNKMYGDFVDGG